MFELLQKSQTENPVTFGEPGGNTSFSEKLARSMRVSAVTAPGIGGVALALEIGSKPEAYADLFNTAERQQRTVDNVFAETRAQEEVYDRWIATVKAETGIALENPLRGGYRSDAMRAIRNEVRSGGMSSVDGTGGIPDRQLQIFNDRLTEVQSANPDKAETLTFRDVRQEARGVAREAEGNAQRAGKVDVNPVVGFGAQLAGGMWAGRRDPIFVGSLFAGPTSAIGKTAIARIASAGLFQGFFNAGVSALEQPTVQAWRQEVGVRSGIMPAVENVGMAFLFGLIPGAAIRGVQESAVKAARPAMQRIIEGNPRAGDEIEALRVLANEDQQMQAALRTGSEMQDADRAFTPRPARDMPPELHNDMNAAALRHADDPLESPSPEAVRAVEELQTLREVTGRNEPGTYPAIERRLAELENRIAEANPQTKAEAQMIASEVIEQQGTKADTARVRQEIDEPLPAPPPPKPDAPAARPARDPMEKIPWVRDDGTPTTISRKQLAEIGQRDAEFSMLVRSCK